MKKKVLLVGATGFVGSAILDELLARGHHVTALLRDPQKLARETPLLSVRQGDVADKEALIAAAAGQDAVISAYNPGWTNPNMYEDTKRLYPQIVKAVKAAGVKRLQVVGGASVLFLKPGERIIDAGILPAEIMPGVRGLFEFYMETLSQERDLDWVYFVPAPEIHPGERSGKYVLGTDSVFGSGKISVKDYAVAMVDELEQETHHQTLFTAVNE